MDQAQANGDITTYCIKSNIIYGVTATDATNYVKKLTDAPGIHVFIKTSDAAISEVDLYDESVSIASGDVAKLALYNCNGSKCEAAYGYVKIGASYYSVTTGVGPATVTTNDSQVGVLKADKKVKSTDNGDIPFSSDDSLRYYKLDGTVDGSNPFTKTTTGNVIIEAGKFAIVKNTITKGNKFFLFFFLFFFIFFLFFFIFFIFFLFLFVIFFNLFLFSKKKLICLLKKFF